MCAKGVLLICAQPWNGHFWSEFFAGAFARRSLIALDAVTGKLLWSGRKGYRSRPLIVGDTIIAEPWAYDLHTGEPVERQNPVTGNYEKWQMSRPGHHCGCIAACRNVLFFRSGSAALYDLKADYGTAHFGGLRSGCWINCIPANGIVTMPEASSGCVCPFALQCTVAFGPRQRKRWWGMYSASGPFRPVMQLCVNFAAPGDRKDSQGKLWLAYPRPRTDRLVSDLPLRVQFWPGGKWRSESVDFPEVKPSGNLSTNDAWIFASAVEGIKNLEIPCTGPSDPPALYRVKLYFIEPDPLPPGSRVFSIHIQDRLVEEKLDILGEAGGRNIPVVKEYGDFVVQGDLKVAFSPRGELDGKAPPLLCALEISRLALLPISASLQEIVLSNFKREISKQIVLRNHTEDTIECKLLVECPPGFKSQISPSNVKINGKGKRTVQFTVSSSERVQAGTYQGYFVLTSKKGHTLRLPFTIRHTGSVGQLVIKACADAFVQKKTPNEPHGKKPYLLVDGGAQSMNDGDFAITFLKFKLNIPGTVKSAKLRLYVSDQTASQSNDSGRIHLVEGEWEEESITFNRRPSLGRQVGVLGRVPKNAPIERPLSVDLEGRKTLSLALVPSTTDGAIYLSREGGKAPELIVTFGPSEKK